jgi:DNA-binding transcriptional LysR family regulator
LTEAGRVFLAEARAVLERADAAVKAAHAVASGEVGEIHVGYAPSPTVELLPCALHAFQNSAPGVRVQLHDLSTEEMLRGLNAGRLHVCLLVRPEPKAMAGLKFEPLREYPVCVVMPPGHPLARQKSLKLAQLAGEKLLAYSRADYPEYHQLLGELLAPLKDKPRIAEEHSSGTGLLAAVEAGRGLVVVSSFMKMLVAGRLAVRPVVPAPAPLQVGALYDAKRLSVAAQKFIAAARVPLSRKARPN